MLLVQAEFHLLSQRLVFGEQDYNANNVLFERGVISERERNQTAANWSSLQQLGNNAEQNITARSMMLEDAHRQYELQKMTAKEELLALKLTLVQLQSQHHELLSRGDYTLTATRAGRVYNLIHAPGEFIDARPPLVTLLPVDYQLEARIYLPSRAIGKKFNPCRQLYCLLMRSQLKYMDDLRQLSSQFPRPQWIRGNTCFHLTCANRSIWCERCPKS